MILLSIDHKHVLENNKKILLGRIKHLILKSYKNIHIIHKNE